jgi:hypothetical protein
MQVIAKPCGEGKTTDLLELAHSGNYYIVTHSAKAARALRNEAIRKGYIINFPMTYSEFINGEYAGENIDGFLVDDVDMLTKYITNGVPIKAITVTITAESQTKYTELHCPNCKSIIDVQIKQTPRS